MSESKINQKTILYITKKYPCKSNIYKDMGDPGETRTPNLLIRSQMLYPLSYRAFLLETSNTKTRH